MVEECVFTNQGLSRFMHRNGSVFLTKSVISSISWLTDARGSSGGGGGSGSLFSWKTSQGQNKAGCRCTCAPVDQVSAWQQHVTSWQFHNIGSVRVTVGHFHFQSLVWWLSMLLCQISCMTLHSTWRDLHDTLTSLFELPVLICSTH